MTTAMKTARVVALVVATIFVLFVTASIGPLSSRPSLVRVNDAYVTMVRQHELLLGACGFMAALALGALAKVTVLTRVLVAFLAGTIYLALVQAEDLDFFRYMGGELVEFHSRYLASGGVVLLLFSVTSKLWQAIRRRDERPGT